MKCIMRISNIYIVQHTDENTKLSSLNNNNENKNN